VAVTLQQITGQVEEQLRAHGLRLPSDERGPHMLGVQLPAAARRRVAAALAEGNVHAAVRGASLRVSPHLWTTEEDVARLVGALARAVEA
jgi:selenocysteine lyase/cysteine desulfurase